MNKPMAARAKKRIERRQQRVELGRLRGPKYASLSAMERDARGAVDKTVLWNIRGVVLQIRSVRSRYEYVWGVNNVTRDVAHGIIVSAQ